MAGLSIQGSGPSARRALDSEINMIPMIDLLVSCIAFLLLTAVWSQMSRLPASVQHPGATTEPLTPKAPRPVLHVDARDEATFALAWKQGTTVVRTLSVRRQPVDVEQGKTRRFPDLASAVTREWSESGLSHHDAADGELDLAVLHTGDHLPFKDLIAIIDAIYAPKRTGERASPAFSVAFATD